MYNNNNNNGFTGLTKKLYPLLAFPKSWLQKESSWCQAICISTGLRFSWVMVGWVSEWTVHKLKDFFVYEPYTWFPGSPWCHSVTVYVDDPLHVCSCSWKYHGCYSLSLVWSVWAQKDQRTVSFFTRATWVECISSMFHHRDSVSNSYIYIHISSQGLHLSYLTL